MIVTAEFSYWFATFLYEKDNSLIEQESLQETRITKLNKYSPLCVLMGDLTTTGNISLEIQVLSLF